MVNNQLELKEKLETELRVVQDDDKNHKDVLEDEEHKDPFEDTMDRQKREEINRKFAERRAQITKTMSQLDNAPNLIIDRQIHNAQSNNGQPLQIEQMYEEQKEKNVDQVVRSHAVMELDKRNIEYQKARENERNIIIKRTNLAQRSLSNMIQKVKEPDREVQKGLEMILPQKQKIVVKNSLEQELAKMRGYEVPSYNNQRGWAENRDNIDSMSQRDSQVYESSGGFTNPHTKTQNSKLRNLNEKIRNGSMSQRSISVQPRGNILINKDIVRFPAHRINHQTIGYAEDRPSAIPALPQHQLSQEIRTVPTLSQRSSYQSQQPMSLHQGQRQQQHSREVAQVPYGNLPPR